MKKTLLSASGLLLGLATLQASVPEGNLYILGVNGDDTPSETNCLVPQERDEEDIDEGLWRWKLAEIELTVKDGSVTISDGSTFTLGYDENNIFGLTNMISSTQNQVYLVPGGPGVNYSLESGAYEVTLACFEDLDGDMGGDSWVVGFRSLKPVENKESYYLLGFNDYLEPGAACRFLQEVTEEDGETIVTNTLKRYYISDCEDGFTVYDGLQDVVLGLDTSFGGGDVTPDMPMAFLAAGGEPVKCTLPDGYYDVNFASMGAMSMISFLRCEDQTAQDQLAYYLVGLNGVDALNDAYVFTREEVNESYTDEDTGEEISYTSFTYSLKGVEVKENCGFTVVSQENWYSFGYNSDFESFMPNNFGGDMPFAAMAVGGDAVNSTLEAGKYDFNFVITGVNTAMISALPTEEGAVGGISSESGADVYFNLQGVRVQNPENGIFIKVEDGKVTKVAR